MGTPWLPLVVIACGSCGAPETRPPERPALDVSALMSQHHVPGLALAIVRRQGDPIIETYGVGITPDTVFEAASLGKPVTALMVVRDPSRLSLDRPVLDLLGGSYTHRRRGAVDIMAAGSGLETATPRMLLSHTAGLPNWSRDRPLAIEERRGEWHYSSEGFLVLQACVEAAEHEAFDVTARRLVFAPLGMTRSSFVGTTTTGGHDRAGQAEDSSLPVDAQASSSLRTTITDYARFAQSLLTAPEAARLLVPQVTVGLAHGLGWGLGLGVDQVAGSTYFFQPGANPGFRALLVGSRERGEAIVLLTNGDDGLELAPAIVRAQWGIELPLFTLPLMHPND